MKIHNLKEKFAISQIEKKDFIDRIHSFHLILQEFSTEISNTEIEKIEIIDKQVLFHIKNHFGDQHSKFIANFEDKRDPPLESFNFNIYEGKDSLMIFEMLKHSDVVFDIGANIGWYSIQFAKMNESKEIYSFEPVDKIFKKLKDNGKINDLKNIKYFNNGFSDKNETIELFYNPELTGSSSIKNLYGNPLQKISCKLLKLDDFTDHNNVKKLDFIKLDVEGAELLVLNGGLQTIKNLKPILFVELLRKWASKFGYHPNDVINILKVHGYKCFITSDKRLIKISEINDKTIETNFFFLHADKHHRLIEMYNEL